MAEEVNFKPGELPEGLVVIKFGANWCGPCRILAPQFDTLEYPNVKTISIDVSDNPEWSPVYAIRSIPTTIGFKDGEEVFRVGGNKINDIKSGIEANI